MDCTQCGEPLKKDDVLHSTGQCWANLRARADAAESEVALYKAEARFNVEHHEPLLQFAKRYGLKLGERFVTLVPKVVADLLAAEAQVAALRSVVADMHHHVGMHGETLDCYPDRCAYTGALNDTAALATAHDAQVWKAAMERAVEVVGLDGACTCDRCDERRFQARKLRALAAAGPGK